MKNLSACGVLWLISLAAQAQGTFTFSNRSIAVGLDQPIVYPCTLEKVSGSQYVAAVFLNGTQLGGVAHLRDGAGAGYWDSGVDNTRTVTGKFSGEPVTGFTVKVWDSSRGATMEAARDAGGRIGESITFSIVLGGPKRDPNLLADVPGVMTNFRGFSFQILGNCPEPSVVALGAMGAIGYLLRHRLGFGALKERAEKPDGRDRNVGG
jgi:hypothetical protein